MRAVFLLLMGCLHRGDAVRAPEPWAVEVTAVLAAEDDPVVDVPPAVEEALARVLAERGLQPRVIDGVSMEDVLEVRRSTEARLDALGQREAAVPLRLLVEAEARFYSQLGGRYRWTVDVTATVVGEGEPHTERFSVPVHLLFDHQRAPEALEHAMPLIERRIGRLVDGWLRERD